MTELIDIKLGDLHPAKDNPRKNMGDLTDLAASMKELGVIEPIVAVRNGAGYTIVAGHRRYAAAKKAKLTDVPVVVRELTEAQRIETMLVENLHREDLTAVEEAVIFQRLVTECGYAQRKLAEQVGVSQAHVSKRLSLLKLPKDALAKLDAGELTVKDGLELTKLKDLADVPAILEEAGKGRWRSIEQLVNTANEARVRLATIEKAKEQAKPHGWSVEQVGGLVQSIGKEAYSAELSKLDVTKHEALDCHCLIVTYQNEIQPGCKNTANHEKRQRFDGNIDEAARARRKAMMQRTPQRREFVATTIQKPVAATVRAQLITEAMLRAVNSDVCKMTVSLLGLEVEKDDAGYRDFRGALKAFATTSDKVGRLAVALSMGQMESTISGPQCWDKEAGLSWLDTLKTLGYKVSKDERDFVKGAV